MNFDTRINDEVSLLDPADAAREIDDDATLVVSGFGSGGTRRQYLSHSRLAPVTFRSHSSAAAESGRR